MLKPALARGELQCIGATTMDEFAKIIEKDGALDRRFQKIVVEPTDIKQSISILNNIKSNYEEFHQVTYNEEAIEAEFRNGILTVTLPKLPAREPKKITVKVSA